MSGKEGGNFLYILGAGQNNTNGQNNCEVFPFSSMGRVVLRLIAGTPAVGSDTRIWS
jgi:hypothetical protein